MSCPAEMEEMAEMKSLKRLNSYDKQKQRGVCKLLWLRNKENHENPIDGIITLSEYSPLLVLILLVCKHTDSLTTKNGIPYQESNPINGKTVKTEGSQTCLSLKTPSVPLFRGKIGMREEGYKFQGSGQLWLMVQGN